MRQFAIILISCLLTSTHSNDHDRGQSYIEIDIACGFAGVTSLSILNVHQLVNSKSYIFLRRKLFSENRAEALISVVALRELQSKRVINLSSEELVQIDKISSWGDNYSVCHTCTEHFQGSVNELLANQNTPAYLLIKARIFNVD